MTLNDIMLLATFRVARGLPLTCPFPPCAWEPDHQPLPSCIWEADRQRMSARSQNALRDLRDHLIASHNQRAS